MVKEREREREGGKGEREIERERERGVCMGGSFGRASVRRATHPTSNPGPGDDIFSLNEQEI